MNANNATKPFGRSRRGLSAVFIGAFLGTGSLYPAMANADLVTRTFDDSQLRSEGPPAMSPSDLPDMQHILDDYITDKDMAIALGKAFFWDQAGGSKGQACASCHFNAGADNRSRNTLNPGSPNMLPGVDPTMFDETLTGGGGVNYQMQQGDFPFPKFSTSGNPFDDIVGSQGTFEARLKANPTPMEAFIANRTGQDVCESLPSIFSKGGLNHRQVTGRNTPTVVNAVFNHRNFWDGRANDLFNGIDPLGRRGNHANPNQGIWINDNGDAEKKQILIKHSSLASQAVGPPLSTVETTCQGRVFPMLGRKLIPRFALSVQRVSPMDSVLGGMVNTAPRARGLTITYEDMIKQSFQSKYWDLPGTVEDGFTQMEANFSLFWGLAIQMYEATLFSDQTRYDDFQNGDDFALTEQEKLGLELFIRSDRGKCAACHDDSPFTGATVKRRNISESDLLTGGTEIDPETGELVMSPEPMERMRMGNNEVAVYDGGFYNIGVTDTRMDIGLGADLAGFPLSFSRQASTGNIIDDEAKVDAKGEGEDPAEFTGPVQPGERVAVDGAFKTPGLRNIDMTAPYFHNGSHRTLEEVVISYQLGFRHLFANENHADLDADISEIDLEGLDENGNVREGEIAALVALLKALTDERVLLHQAPFDHPELRQVNGSTELDRNRDGNADDSLILIPAVGASGYAAPLPGFLE